MTMNLTARILAAVLGATSFAAAASTTSAAITKVTFTLVDLTPDDGRTPFFMVQSGKSWSSYLGLQYYSRADRPSYLTSTTAFDDLDLGARRTGADFASVEGSSERGGRKRRWVPSAFACNGCRLVLSGHARLVISGDYALEATSNGGTNPWKRPDRSASAWGQAFVRDSTATLQSFADSVGVPGGFGPPQGAEASGRFELTIDNLQPHRDRDLFLSVGVGGTAFSPSVPEPTTFAMLLAGLAGVGWLARRRSA